MRIEEAVRYMSKAYLHRVIDSFTRDLDKPDVEESQNLIVRNVKELADEQHIATELRRGAALDEQLLMKMLLEGLLAAEDKRLAELVLIERTQHREKELVGQANDGDALKYKDSADLGTYRTVLKVALEDDVISQDELNLLRRLRRHLGLRERDHFLLQAQLGEFPTPGNTPHSPSQIVAGLTELQKRGIVFYCNRAGTQPFYVIPEEIADSVETAVGIHLTERSYELLLDHISRGHLRTILESFKLPTSGKKGEQAARIIDAGLSPAESLFELDTDELQEVCKSLPGVTSSGTKAERVDNIISHFAKLGTISVSEDADPRERYH